MSSEIGMTRRFARPMVEVTAQVRDALKAQGFGVLTEIDVRRTLREKIDAEFRPYLILGACNPRLAKRALEAEPAVGLILPCNVTVYEDRGETVVSMFDPKVGLGLVDSEAVTEGACEAKALLKAALDSL